MTSERTRPESLIRAALFLIPAGTIIMAQTELAARPAAFRGPLDPVGKIHIPIGIADTVDTLKTFVEAEGCFSPGFCTYGVYFWVHDAQSGKLTAPTMRGVKCDRGLGAGGHLIPWTSWGIDGLTLGKTEDRRKIRDMVLREYNDHYRGLGMDGIYFQTLTETSEMRSGEMSIAAAACALVNETSAALLERDPKLLIQFGLHATSIRWSASS